MNEPKLRTTPITDPVEIKTFTAVRWKEGIPLTWKLGDTVYAQADVTKEYRITSGKMS